MLIERNGVKLKGLQKPVELANQCWSGDRKREDGALEDQEKVGISFGRLKWLVLIVFFVNSIGM